MKRGIVLAAGLICSLFQLSAYAFSNLYVFGDSISDSGNNDLAFKQLSPPNGAVTAVPIPNTNTFIPTFPYASGHYTDGAVWAQSFAQALGLHANPSLAGGTDFAFGGARSSGAVAFPGQLTLTQQARTLLAAHPQLPSDGLYVVEGGGNNARDALTQIAADPLHAPAIAQSAADEYANDIKGIVHDLEQAGAQDIVVWNVPDLGKAPSLLAISSGATSLAQLMNQSLAAGLLGDSRVRLFDFFGVIDRAVATPQQFGLTDVTNACARFAGCDPEKFLFWDGIHPTSAGHELLSDAMLALVPEPSVYAGLLAGLIAIAALMRGRLVASQAQPRRN